MAAPFQLLWPHKSRGVARQDFLCIRMCLHSAPHNTPHAPSIHPDFLRSGGLLGARGVAGDSCLYGETYALRMVRARYPDSARVQQAAQYYLGGGPALTGPQILLRVFNVNVTALQAYQSDPEVPTPAG